MMAIHEQSVGKTNEWYTPPHVFEALGTEFDMDVSSPGIMVTPWVPARAFLTRDSLQVKWSGFVWMNPPFGARNGLVPWLKKFLSHNNGVGLVPDRTSAPWWQEYVPQADLILFVSPKIEFIGKDGVPGSSPGQGTTLLAVGDNGCRALRNAACAGLGTLFTQVGA